MNVYENIVILDASLSDEGIQEATGKITELITASGGEILKIDPWGRRKLAYEIKKQTKGYYVMFVFKGPSTLNKKLEDYYKVLDAVFKFMIVKLEKAHRTAVLAGLQPKETPPAPQQEAAPAGQ